MTDQEHPYPKATPELLDAAIAMDRELCDLVNEASLTGNNNDRARVGLNLISRAVEIGTAILYLHTPQVPLAGAARALVRPLLEAYIRGLWWCRCALDEIPAAKDNDIDGRNRRNINLYLNDHRGKKSSLWRWRTLLREIPDPAVSRWVEGTLRHKGAAPGDPTIQEMLNDWTHAGVIQSITGIGPQTIEPTYPRETQDFVVLFASTIGFLAVCEMARFMSKPDAAAASLADIMGRYSHIVEQ
ncbi:MAG: hypothetical protein OXU70_13535 [Gammaproteobacteria bacterium]|nr:hypothetical protein [Gammaproteobacteria bacterium]